MLHRESPAGNGAISENVQGVGHDDSTAPWYSAAEVAEAALLGACFISPEAADHVCRELPPEAWSRHAHRIVFGAVKALHDRCVPIDVTSVTVELMDRHQLDEAGGPVALVSLQDPLTCSAASWHWYRGIVEREYARRTLRRACVAAVARLDAGQDPAEVASELAVAHE